VTLSCRVIDDPVMILRGARLLRYANEYDARHDVCQPPMGHR
jgi:hypothetical protein